MSALVSLRRVTKSYVRGKQKVEVLHGIDLDIQAGEFLALMGPSGSGKTTMLNLIAGLDQPTGGEVIVGDDRIDKLSRSALTERFTRYLGVAPMTYLTDWRLELGAEALRTSNRGVQAITLEVGYESEAAFNRAFKRRFQVPPARYRREWRARGGARPPRRAPNGRSTAVNRAG